MDEVGDLVGLKEGDFVGIEVVGDTVGRKVVGVGVPGEFVGGGGSKAYTVNTTSIAEGFTEPINAAIHCSLSNGTVICPRFVLLLGSMY